MGRPDAGVDLPGDIISLLEQQLNDPELRLASHAAFRDAAEKANPGITAELRLTPEEADRLFDRLAATRQGLAAIDAVLAEAPDHGGVAAWATRNRRILQREQSESLKMLLGDARYALWQEYQETRPVRVQASRHAHALAAAGAPLDDNQSRALATAMIEEQLRLQQDVLSLARNVVLEYPETQAQAQAALQRRRGEMHQQVLVALSPLLNAQQLSMLRNQMEAEATTR